MKRTFLLCILLVLSLTSSYAQHWSYKTLHENKLDMDVAVIGNKIFFYSGIKQEIGGESMLVEEVEIFDLAKDTREIVPLTGDAVRYYSATATLNSKVYFAGGLCYPREGGISKRVDIYDTLTGTWSTAQLSLNRQNFAGASAGGKVVFGGGYNFGVRRAVDKVDIYNSITDTWTGTNFNGYAYNGSAEYRHYLTATSVGDKIFFAGGTNALASNKVNIYDAVQNKWLPEASLSQPKYWLSSVTYQNKAYFIGGAVEKNEPLGIKRYQSDTIDIYDNTTNSWSVIKIPRLTMATNGAKRGIFQSAIAGCKIFMAPGLSGWQGPTYDPQPGTEDTITVYDIARDTWSYITLPHSRTGTTVAAAGNKVLFAGGRSYIFPGGTQNHIDILTLDPNLRISSENNSITTYDFGNVALESSLSSQVTLSNEGDYDLLFDALESRISITGDIDDFIFNEEDLKLIDILSPAQQFTLPVTFRPTTLGFKQVVISIHSNDPDQPEYFFTLQGNGSTITSATEIKTVSTIQCYPNPTSGNVNIKSDLLLPYHVQIFDLLGHLTAEEEINNSNQEINLSNFPQGLYFLKVSEVDQNIVIPLLKK